jgi:hypothetical protein
MMHNDEQGIAYNRHLERINISYQLEYNFPSRYSCNPISLRHFIENHLSLPFLPKRLHLITSNSTTRLLITYTRNH